MKFFIFNAISFVVVFKILIICSFDNSPNGRDLIISSISSNELCKTTLTSCLLIGILYLESNAKHLLVSLELSSLYLFCRL